MTTGQILCIERPREIGAMHTAKALFAYVHGPPEPKPSTILCLSDEPGSDRESLEIGQSVDGGRRWIK
jgi:hypothetical protein